MFKTSIFALFLGLQSHLVSAGTTDNCRSLAESIFSNKEAALSLKTNWSKQDKKELLSYVKGLSFSNEKVTLLIESLNLQKDPVSLSRVKTYLNYVLNLSEKDQTVALSDIAQLDAYERNSEFVRAFEVHEKKILKKFESRAFTPKEMDRYQELYYGCRAFRPNDVNKHAATNFKNFNLSLSLGTLGASYAFYNMDKEINGEWFAKLGYDIGITVLFSYVGSNIQTNAADTQIVKSLKSYLIGRVLGVTDLAIYDPIFNNEREQAVARIEELKNNPEYKKKIDALLIEYKERSLYREYKEKLISTIKNLPYSVGLGIKGQSVDENNVDWNNLKREDLDRPEVQDILVLASMAQIYHESRGDWIDTGDKGMDRYAFNAVFYAVQIPKSIVQNYITYQMLCMGQDNMKLSFTKAVLFNVGANFLVNQVLFGYREKAINQ